MRRPPRNPELEAAIIADPESPDAYQVYGDWLQEQGEPLGELVSVQAALAMQQPSQSTTSRRLQKRENALLTEHARGWLGYFAKYQHTWRFGFLDTLNLTEPGREDFVELLDLVAARFLRGLELEVLGHRVFENSDLISAVGELGLPPILTRLSLVPTVDPRSVDLGALRVLWPRLTRIRELTIKAGNVDLGSIDLPMAESIAFTTSATPETITALANARWPKLTSFSLACTYNYQTVEPERLEPLVLALEELGTTTTTTTATTIRHLDLSGHFCGDPLLERLSASPLLSKLSSLTLSQAGITDVGAQSLIDRKDKFEHLDRLGLRENYFTKPICEALGKAFGKTIDVANQGVPNPYNDGADENYDDGASEDEDIEDQGIS